MIEIRQAAPAFDETTHTEYRWTEKEETGMALFGKNKDKEKKHCPICNNEMTFLKSVALADGTICSDCEAMLRGKYDIDRWWHLRFDGTVKQKSHDPLLDMSIADVQAIIAEAKQNQAETVGSLGGEFSALLTADDVFSIEPKAKDVGVKRAKAYKNRLVVRGMIQSGEFSREDSVVILHGDARLETVLLDVIPCGGAVDFNTELKANMHKKTAGVNTNAWLILDVEQGVAHGDVIAKA